MCEKQLSRQEKGDAYQLCTRDVLQHIYSYFGVTSFDWRTPGRQQLHGAKGKFDCDIVAYKPDGTPVIFSCKYRSSVGAKIPDVAELFLEIVDVGAEGYLVSNIDPQKTPGNLVDAYTAGMIVLREGAGLDEWFASISGLIQSVFQGMGEAVRVADAWEITTSQSDQQ